MKKVLKIFSVCMILVALIIGAVGILKGGLNDINFLFWM